jgi:diketogulonate reductase-like aldo/keto reductase
MATLTTDGTARVLSDGNEMPLLGLGVWQVKDGREAEDAVRWALELGYRHIDTAQAYGNERSVGRGLRDSGVAREEVFVATKFYPRARSGDPVAELEGSLRRLGLDHVDLYLIHWPEGGPTWAWPGMQQARERGLARSIGISNFNVGEMDALLAEADAPPAVNGRNLSDERLAEVASRHGKTPAQVLVRWCVERALPVIPKSKTRERIAENGQVFDFSLSDEDMAALDALDETGGTDRAQERPWW